MSRRARLVVLLAAAAPIAGCGPCLVVATRASTLTTIDGTVVPIDVDVRLRGWFDPPDEDQVLGAVLTAPLTELLDTLSVPVCAVRCLLDPNVRIDGGPFGCLAALLPCANLMPAPQAPAPSAQRVTPADLALLRGPDGGDRRAAVARLFANPDVRAVVVR